MRESKAGETLRIGWPQLSQYHQKEERERESEREREEFLLIKMSKFVFITNAIIRSRFVSIITVIIKTLCKQIYIVIIIITRDRFSVALYVTEE